MTGYGELTWELHPPPGPADPAWLSEINVYRARLLYADGLRPGFRADDGRFRDPDPADADAFHVVARIAGRLVATFRALPVVESRSGLCERLLGTDGLHAMLEGLGCDPARAWEGGGWVVDPSWRGTGLGARVLAAGVAVAEQLGLPVMIGAAGVRYGQLRRLTGYGYRPVPGYPLIPAERFVDDLCLVHATTPDAPDAFRTLVRDGAVLLALESDGTADKAG